MNIEETNRSDHDVIKLSIKIFGFEVASVTVCELIKKEDFKKPISTGKTELHM